MRLKFTFAGLLCLLLCSGITNNIFSQDLPAGLTDLITKSLRTAGVPAPEAENWTVSSNYKDKTTGIEYYYVQQTYKGIRVFNNVITLSFRNGKLLYSSGNFVNNISLLNRSSSPVVQPANAVGTAARHLNLKVPAALATVADRFQSDKKFVFASSGIAKKDIETELLWVLDDSSNLHLAWNVNIDVLNSQDWWNVRVDAQTGAFINKDNWTVHENNLVNPSGPAAGVNQNVPAQLNGGIAIKSNPVTRKPWPLLNPPNVESASYLVVPFPNDSRNFSDLNFETNPWQRAGAGNNATTYGWHFDGFTNYNITRGNNVFAYEDSANRNNAGRVVTSTTAAPFVTFNVAPDFSRQPFDTVNRNFGIVNLFYWNNIIHDVTYQYGFDENSGNFQADNLNRGGTGNDFVRAEAQDGSGTDNANFSTSPDGNSGRMQMYLWYGPALYTINSPGSIAGSFSAPESSFSLNNRLIKTGTVTGQIVFFDDRASGGTTHEACDSTLQPLNPVAGKIALVYRGNCNFTQKARSVQKAGAIGMIVINNAPGAAIVMGGTPLDNLITIPAIMVPQDVGARLVAELSNGVNISMSSGTLLDGDADNGIVVHEYGHGVSNRLTGGRLNASCLSNAEQGGEGWSDYLALMITTNWQNMQLADGEKARPVGTYASGQNATGSGLRRVPYSTDMLIDTLTYRSLSGNGEVHAIGEVWCSALWDMTWNIIKQAGNITPDIYNGTADGGNIIAMRLVMEGMKLQPCRPGFLDARNAILAADSILYDNKHKCAIWDAFARRGMGYSALQGLSSSTTDQVAAFDVPGGVTINKSALSSFSDAGTEISHDITVKCQCQVPAKLYSISDTIPAGFTYVSSTNGSVINSNVISFSPISFSTPLDSLSLRVTLRAMGENCPLTRPVNDDRDANQIGGLTSNRIAGTTSWVSSTSRAFSNSNSWFAANPIGASNFTLTSDNIMPGKLSVLSFWHYFVTENGLDGGKVEISSDDGTSWLDAKPYFLQNGYNGLLTAASPQPNTFAFTGTSNATSSANNGQFIQSIVNLSSFTGRIIRFRFRFQTNNSNAGNLPFDGWFIDDIMLSNGCGSINRITLLNSDNIKVDSLAIPRFITSPNAPLPLTLVQFNAKQAGSEVLLTWETASEINTKGFFIERSVDGLKWTFIGSVDALAGGNNRYKFNDRSPLEELNHYRIRMYDQDGKFTYTVIKKVQFNTVYNFSMLPNPATDLVTLYFGRSSHGSEILLTDIQGKLLQRHKVADNLNSFPINTSMLSPGTYLVRVQSKSGVITRKLVIH